MGVGVRGSGFTYGPFQKSSLQSPCSLAPGPAALLTPEVTILTQSCLAQGAGGTHHTTQLYSVAESCSGWKSPSLTGEQLVTSRCVQFLLSPGRGTFLCPLPRGSLGTLETGSLGQGDPFLVSQGSMGQACFLFCSPMLG